MKRNMNAAATGAFFGLLVAVVYFLVRLTDPTGVLRESLFAALLTGLVGGVLFGFYIKSFVKRQASSFDEVRERLSKGCEILYDAPANHFYNDEPVGGWLYLTDKGLYFAANPLNMLSHTVRLTKEQILSVTLTKQLGFKNGFSVETPRGKEDFTLSRPEKWIEHIKSA